MTPILRMLTSVTGPAERAIEEAGEGPHPLLRRWRWKRGVPQNLDGRWPEAETQTAIYTRYHPGDRVLAERVAGALRAARQAEPAAAFSQTRGTR